MTTNTATTKRPTASSVLANVTAKGGKAKQAAPAVKGGVHTYDGAPKVKALAQDIRLTYRRINWTRCLLNEATTEQQRQGATLVGCTIKKGQTPAKALAAYLATLTAQHADLTSQYKAACAKAKLPVVSLNGGGTANPLRQRLGIGLNHPAWFTAKQAAAKAEEAAKAKADRKAKRAAKAASAAK